MSTTDQPFHYGRPGLVDDIRAQLSNAGVDLDHLEPSALAGIDEFHLGGRAATHALIDQLELAADVSVLDVGCGIGGAARSIAAALGVSGAVVTGVDLTPEFVDTARHLSELVGLGERTRFEVGNATSLPFDDGEFDVATMIHVGMNITDKQALFAELARVVCPGGTVLVFDIMRSGDGDISFPVPWAADASNSFVAGPTDYRDAMSAAGLDVSVPIDWTGFVREVIKKAAANPAPVNLSHLMGDSWPTMFGNLMSALNAGTVAPTQIVGTRPS